VTITPEDLATLDEQIAYARDDVERGGLSDPQQYGPAVYLRHAVQVPEISSDLHADHPESQCACTAHGRRCALVRAAPEQLCPACQRVCAEATS
jgi:hypothetical protein